MKLEDLRIGVEPNYLDNLDPRNAGDRYRIYPFVEVLRSRGLDIRLLEGTSDDVDVLITARRVHMFEAPRRRGRFQIFDVSDCIVVPPRDLGLLKRLWFHLKVKPRIARFLSSMDLVVAGSQEQVKRFSRYARTVRIPDPAIHLASELQPLPSLEKLVFFWEGQGGNFQHLVALLQAQKPFFRRPDVELLVCTDERDHKGQDNEAILTSLEVNARFVPWTKANYIACAQQAHVGLTPIDTSCPFARAKPENKAIGYLGFGLPVLAADTLAYAAVSAECSSLRTYHDEAGCGQQLDWFLEHKAELPALREAAHGYVRDYYNVDRIADQWQELLVTVAKEL